MIEASTIPVTNPRGVSATYANNIGVAATMLDFTIFFIETGQLPSASGPAPQNELKAAVTLPIPCALGLIEALNQLVKGAQDRMMQQQAAAAKALSRAPGATQ